MLLAERGKSGTCSACPIAVFYLIHLQLATGQVVIYVACWTLGAACPAWQVMFWNLFCTLLHVLLLASEIIYGLKELFYSNTGWYSIPSLVHNSWKLARLFVEWALDDQTHIYIRPKKSCFFPLTLPLQVFIQKNPYPKVFSGPPNSKST